MECGSAFWEIQTGMKKCADIGKIPYSMGIDTWAVDFVLLDDQGQRIGDAVAYRDARTDGMDKQVYEIISENDLYEITGIQKQKFNTIYQLMALKQQNPESLDRAQSMLMIPDYFNFLLTGNKLQEYTNATTTQLVDPKANDWNWALIDRLGYPRTLFQTIMMAGSIVGNLADSIQKQVGFECKVVLPATHDTASAVMAVPSKEEQPLYISSGTWSLMGTELKEAACDEQSRKHNMTNEGGYDYRFRYLKNIMGLWMIQSVRKEIAPELGFGEISELASKQTIPSFVDANDPRFLAPEHMTSEVQKACKESGQQVPQGIAEVACVIYNSLAKCYADTAKEIEKLTGKIQELTKWFTSLSPAQQQTILKVGLVVAAIGPLSIGFGKVAKGISDTVTTGQKFVSGAAKIIAKITAKTAATAAGTAADTAGTAATAAHTAATTAATATTGGMTVHKRHSMQL